MLNGIPKCDAESQLDPQSLAVQSVGELIGTPLLIGGQVILGFGGGNVTWSAPTE